MLKLNDMQELRTRMDEFDNLREDLIKRSRDLIKLSKQIIYSVHRNNLTEAGEQITEIKKVLDDINVISKAYLHRPIQSYNSGIRRSNLLL
jgi:predicted translin family RNA/ssDNA-binding protein